MTDADQLRSGCCPICLAGPFNVPLNHLVHKHGIDRFEARRLFGLGRSESVASPEHRALRRAQVQRQRAAGHGPVAVHPKVPLVCSACGARFEARSWPPGPRWCSNRCWRRGRSR